MKKRYLLALILISSSFTYCVQHKNDSKEMIQAISPGETYLKKFNNQEARDSLLTNIYIKGDSASYKELKDIYFLSGHTDDFLAPAMIMANDYNYHEAFEDVYRILHNVKTDSKSNKLADYYLLRAYEIDSIKSNFLMKERFGKAFPKRNSNEYWKTIHESN
ncbi:hypothetical protein D3C87_142580 [compost metagenome]